MSKNLGRDTEGGFKWKCNLPVLYQNYDAIIGSSLNPFVRFEGDTLFIKGGDSDRYIDLDEDTELLTHHFPQAMIIEIPNAGHWVHSEQSEQFITNCLSFLNQ